MSLIIYIYIYINIMIMLVLDYLMILKFYVGNSDDSLNCHRVTEEARCQQTVNEKITLIGVVGV